MKKSVLFLSALTAISISASAQGAAKRINLGPNINSPTLTDANQILSPDGRTLYFKRQMPGTNYDIYYSQMDENNQWKPAVEIKELNNNSENSVNYIFPDGNRMILEGKYDGKEGYFTSNYDGSTWSKPVPIKFDNEPSWDNASVSLSTNGKVMAISNHADLFVSFLNENGTTWSEPKAITSLNTDKYEYTVYLASDDKTLYFSGNGYPVLGDNDILKTTRLDDTWMKWTTPERLDETINSTNWESYFAISAAGDYAYVYSRTEGDGDIYSLPLTAANKPNPVALIKGNVINAKTNAPVEAQITYDFIDVNKNAGTAVSNPKTGHYNVVLQYGKKYILAAKAANYISLSDMLDLSEIGSYKEIVRDIKMYPLEVGETIALNNLFFETNKSEIKTESYAELERLLTVLNSYPNLKIEIAGHTDNVGNAEANKKLSQDRANSVVTYLIGKGVDKGRLKGVGYGKAKPISDNNTDEGRAKNRRVEFSILSK